MPPPTFEPATMHIEKCYSRGATVMSTAADRSNDTTLMFAYIDRRDDNRRKTQLPHLIFGTIIVHSLF